MCSRAGTGLNAKASIPTQCGPSLTGSSWGSHSAFLGLSFSFQNETPKQILSSSKFGVSVAVYLHIAVSALRGLGCLQLPCSRARGLSGCRARESLAAEPGLSCPVAHAKLVSRPGIKPVSPAGEGGFPTSGPRGKSLLLSSLQIGSLSTFVSILKFKKYELSSEIYLSKMKVV